MATYSIDSANGQTMHSGIQGEGEARKIAQRMANERGESVYLYATPVAVDIDGEGTDEPEEIKPSADARIILDNGGGIVLQFGGWACSPAGDNVAQVAAQAALLIREWLATGSTKGWEGHDPDALAVQLTDEDTRNGGYRVITIDRDTDSAATLATEVRWGAMGEALGDALAE